MRNERQQIQSLVKDFSSRMREKLLKKLGRGWRGWENDAFKRKLEDDILIHLRLALQGDASQWVDVANYAAFLDYQSRQATTPHDGPDSDEETAGIDEELADTEDNYPCEDCGAPRTKAQGGTIFTVCDDCWDKHHAATDTEAKL